MIIDGIRKYNKSCIKCNKSYMANSSSQKYCNDCKATPYLCACGCGKERLPISDKDHILFPKYILGHNFKGKLVGSDKIEKGVATRMRNGSYKKTEEQKKYMSQKMAGHPAQCGKTYFDKVLGHKVRSTWESLIGRTLKFLKINYEYEKIFLIKYPNGVQRYYWADFVFNILGNTVYEVKGYFRSSEELLKLKLFKEQYPQYKLFLVGTNKAMIQSIKGVHYDCFIDYNKCKRFMVANYAE